MTEERKLLQITRTANLAEKQWDLILSMLEDELDTQRLELRQAADADDFEFLTRVVGELEALDETLHAQLRRTQI